MHTMETKSARTARIHAEGSGLSIVSITIGGRNYGLYRVKQLEGRSMVVGHGAISFPVGTHLEINGFKPQIPQHAPFHQNATVVENGSNGIRLIW